MLNKSKLKNDIYNALIKNIKGEGGATNEAKNIAQNLANDLADAIHNYIIKADIKVIAPSGTINVVGSPSAQSNATPIIIEGKPEQGGGIS